MLLSFFSLQNWIAKSFEMWPIFGVATAAVRLEQTKFQSWLPMKEKKIYITMNYIDFWKRELYI